jgi:hypothetical protein
MFSGMLDNTDRIQNHNRNGVFYNNYEFNVLWALGRWKN